MPVWFSIVVLVLWNCWLFAMKGLGFIFDSHLTFSDQISSLFKSSYYHILRCIRPYQDRGGYNEVHKRDNKKTQNLKNLKDLKTASTIVTSIVHSKLDYCNTLYYNLPKSQTNRLQVFHNSLARAVVKAPKFCHVTPILKSLHWLKINERIKYRLLSLTNKALTTAQPTYLHSLISVQPPRATRSSSVVTLSRPPTSSSLRTTNRSFRYTSPHRWNQLPVSFFQPCVRHPADDVTLSNSPPTCSALSPSITHWLGLYWTGLTLLNGFSFLVIFLFLYIGMCGRLSWPNCWLLSTR